MIICLPGRKDKLNTDSWSASTKFQLWATQEHSPLFVEWFLPRRKRISRFKDDLIYRKSIENHLTMIDTNASGFYGFYGQTVFLRVLRIFFTEFVRIVPLNYVVRGSTDLRVSSSVHFAVIEYLTRFENIYYIIVNKSEMTQKFWNWQRALKI